MREIIRIKSERIIYISCDPMTLARDAAFLRDGWEITDAVFIDMFPHTYHIETALTFERCCRTRNAGVSPACSLSNKII